jgi:hypothetical protein
VPFSSARRRSATGPFRGWAKRGSLERKLPLCQALCRRILSVPIRPPADELGMSDWTSDRGKKGRKRHVCATPGENRSVTTHGHATGKEMWCASCAHLSLSTDLPQFPGNRNAYAGDSAVIMV